MINYKSIEDLNLDLLHNLQRIPHDIDLIVGVPRSGLLVANLIALILNLQITDVDGLLSDRIIGTGSTKTNYYRGGVHHITECKKILVVEDSVYSGSSILSIKKRIEERCLPCEVLYFAAYVMPGKESLVDFYLQVLPGPRIFEWNLFHAARLENCCVDIDGVLCADPTKEENDDGEKYKYFLEHAAPKIIPTHKIRYIVSSRLEKYRPETEKWLEQNNIKYDKLFLLDSTAEERRRKGLHALFKSEIYKQSDCGLFIESAASQAAMINISTGKPVYCLENNKLYDEKPNSSDQEEIAAVKTSALRRFLAKSPLLKKIYRRMKKLIAQIRGSK